jgi:hypothetical protein
MTDLQNGGVEVVETTIKYLIHFNGNAYYLHSYTDMMREGQELTNAVTGEVIEDEDLHEEVMEFFNDNQ